MIISMPEDWLVRAMKILMQYGHRVKIWTEAIEDDWRLGLFDLNIGSDIPADIQLLDPSLPAEEEFGDYIIRKPFLQAITEVVNRIEALQRSSYLAPMVNIVSPTGYKYTATILESAQTLLPASFPVVRSKQLWFTIITGSEYITVERGAFNGDLGMFLYSDRTLSPMDLARFLLEFPSTEIADDEAIARGEQPDPAKPTESPEEKQEVEETEEEQEAES